MGYSPLGLKESDMTEATYHAGTRVIKLHRRSIHTTHMSACKIGEISIRPV